MMGSAADIATGRRAGGSSLADSAQLRDLRSDLEASRHRFAQAHKTPLRLGIYAAETGQTITDFGKHSKHWIALFNEGFTLYKSQPLT